MLSRVHGRIAVPLASLARWQYDIEPTDNGCRVTGSAWDRRPAWLRPFTVLATGVRDRSAENQCDIERALARLEVAAERSTDDADVIGVVRNP